jgi:hypothetical protein
MNVPFVDLYAQYTSIREEIDAAIAKVISETSFIGGNQLNRFCEEFAALLGRKHCIAVGNGTDASSSPSRVLALGRATGHHRGQQLHCHSEAISPRAPCRFSSIAGRTHWK